MYIQTQLQELKIYSQTRAKNNNTNTSYTHKKNPIWLNSKTMTMGQKKGLPVEP